MGTLNIANEPHHWRHIDTALQRRGLMRYDAEDWQVSGPRYPDQPFEIFMSHAFVAGHPEREILCAVYPRFVYLMERRNGALEIMRKIPNLKRQPKRGIPIYA